MAGKFAQNTEVSSERSKIEIERTIKRYGATDFASGYQGDMAFIIFSIGGRRVRFTVNLPKFENFELTENFRSRTIKSQTDAWEKACRQIWRALLLCIKAKLESIEAEIATFEQEFLSYIVTSSNQTVGEVILPQIDKVLGEGKMPKLLTGIE